MIDPASTGRAKCRACGGKIAKGELRFGERLPNPFGEGETSYWFHLVCAVCRRPDRIEPILRDTETAIVDHHRLLELAAQGVEHHRLPRIAGVEPDKSGRARCRACRYRIDKGAWRVVLSIWEEGRFSPIGFIHAGCSEDYFGTGDILFRVCQVAPWLLDSEVAEVGGALRNRGVSVRGGSAVSPGDSGGDSVR